MLHKCYIVNTPIFFEAFYNNDIKPHISEATQHKIAVTGEATHNDLLEAFILEELPKLYGGFCECEASCVYSDKGPWADVENKVNY